VSLLPNRLLKRRHGKKAEADRIAAVEAQEKAAKEAREEARRRRIAEAKQKADEEKAKVREDAREKQEQRKEDLAAARLKAQDDVRKWAAAKADAKAKAENKRIALEKRKSEMDEKIEEERRLMQERAEKEGSVTFIVRDAVENEAIVVNLWKNSRFKHVKQAVAKLLGNEDLLEEARLVEKAQGVYVRLKESLPIGDVREAFMVSADLSTERKAGAESPVDVSDAEDHATLVGKSENHESVHGKQQAGSTATNAPTNLRASASSPQSASALNTGTKATSTSASSSTMPSLSKQQAINLMHDCYVTFRADDFQRKLGELENRGLSTTVFAKERKELLLSVQAEVLPNYGFPGTSAGVFKMMAAVGAHIKDPEVAELEGKINKTIGVSRPNALGSTATLATALTTVLRQKPAVKKPRTKPDTSLLGKSSLFAKSMRIRAPAQAISGPAVDGQQEVPPCEYHIAGSWNDYVPSPMFWDGAVFFAEVTIGSKGKESFQILTSGKWELTSYPSIPDANPYQEHEICGPDGSGHGKNWSIGTHREDSTKPGMKFIIVAEVNESGKIRAVYWQEAQSDI